MYPRFWELGHGGAKVPEGVIWQDIGGTKGGPRDSRVTSATGTVLKAWPQAIPHLHTLSIVSITYTNTNTIHKYKYKTQIQKIQIQVLKDLPRATHHLHSLSMVSIRSRNYSQDYCICISVSIKYSHHSTQFILRHLK